MGEEIITGLIIALLGSAIIFVVGLIFKQNKINNSLLINVSKLTTICDYHEKNINVIQKDINSIKKGDYVK
jgi:hypothetical protein